MKQIIINVASKKQAEKILAILSEAEEGELDFSFDCKIEEPDQ